MTLVWYEMQAHQAVSVVIVWTLFAVVLFEIGMNRPSLHLRLQSYVALGATFVRIWFANLNAVEVPGKLSPRIYTVAPLALAFYYVYERLEASAEADKQSSTERGLKITQLTSFLGLITLGAIMYVAMDPERVVIGWSVLVFALMAIAWAKKRLIFHYQALFATACVAFRAFSYNLWSGRPMQMDVTHRPAFCVGITVVLLFFTLPFAFKMREWTSARSNRVLQWIEENPHQIFFFIPLILLTFLLGKEMSHSMITISWGLEGVLVFIFALRAGMRSYRLSGLALLLLCIGKVVVVDVWGLSRPDQILTLIVMSILLGAVSLLYGRFREIIREYL